MMDEPAASPFEAIRHVLHLYCRAIDRLDGDLLRLVYHPDATCDFGVSRGNAIASIPAMLARLRADYLQTCHLLHSSMIEVTGEQATAETYFTAILTRAGDGGTFEERNHGRYLDRFRGGAAGWRIRERLVVMDCLNASPLTPARSEDEIGRLHRGCRGRGDPSYAL